MSDCCGGGCAPGKVPTDPQYRRVLWIALLLNGGMFALELAGGWHAGSASLLADALDFFGDAANYGISLFVLAMMPAARSKVAMLKGATMALYGLIVLGVAVGHLLRGTLPEALTMGWIGTLALLVNGTVALLLYAYRNGDADMRSVWLCTRNDAIGNLAVMLAAVGVFGSGSGWPDLAVAFLMAGLGLSAARSVLLKARDEMRAARPAPRATTTTTSTIELKRR